jgi:glycosyltransferase involved in cell wall biosynthesis
MAIEGIPCRFRVIGKLSDDQRELLEDSGLDWENRYDLTSDEIVQQYVDADLLLFCSTYEGFGLPIVEAQAVGRPVITSNLLSMPEAAGGAALLVDPFDVSSIRAAIKQVIDDEELRNRLINDGYQNAKRFRADVIAAEYAKLYRHLASKLS